MAKPKEPLIVESEDDEEPDDMTGAPVWAKTLYKYMTKLDSVVNGGKERADEPEEKPRTKHWLFGDE